MKAAPPDVEEAPPVQIGSWSRCGLTMRYREYPGDPARPPLICLHGLTRNSRDFETFAATFAGTFRVIAVDFRGRGLSDRDPDPSRYNPATYAADILQLLDELGIDRAIFVGTSLGGLVTMLIAGAQPHRIAGAILNDVGPELDPRGLQRIQSYVGREITFRDWEEAANHVAEISGHLPEHARPADWVRKAQRLCRSSGDSIVLDYDPAIAEPFKDVGAEPAPDLWPLYRALADAAPVLVVRGERSDLLSAAVAKAMCGETSTTRLVTVPGVGHAPDLDEPDAAAAIEDFLRSIAPAPPTEAAHRTGEAEALM